MLLENSNAEPKTMQQTHWKLDAGDAFCIPPPSPKTDATVCSTSAPSAEMYGYQPNVTTLLTMTPLKNPDVPNENHIATLFYGVLGFAPTPKSKGTAYPVQLVPDVIFPTEMQAGFFVVLPQLLAKQKVAMESFGVSLTYGDGKLP